MNPVHCITKHDPENGTYGDCLRAVIASLLDKSPQEVPHFNYDGVDADAVNVRLRQYLASFNLAPWWSHYDPDTPLGELLETFAENNPDCYYLLFGCTRDGESHVVICRNDKVEHDPAWYSSPIVKPGVHGAWSTVVLVRQ